MAIEAQLKPRRLRVHVPRQQPAKHAAGVRPQPAGAGAGKARGSLSLLGRQPRQHLLAGGVQVGSPHVHNAAAEPRLSGAGPPARIDRCELIAHRERCACRYDAPHLSCTPEAAPSERAP